MSGIDEPYFKYPLWLLFWRDAPLRRKLSLQLDKLRVFIFDFLFKCVFLLLRQSAIWIF